VAGFSPAALSSPGTENEQKPKHDQLRFFVKPRHCGGNAVTQASRKLRRLILD
jgi:hypothetical protein